MALLLTLCGFLSFCADDQFGLHIKTVELYSKWIAAKRPAELHIYAKGGHGLARVGKIFQRIPGLTGLAIG